MEMERKGRSEDILFLGIRQSGDSGGRKLSTSHHSNFSLNCHISGEGFVSLRK